MVVNELSGYGLVQWTASKNSDGIYVNHYFNYTSDNKLERADIEIQMDYVIRDDKRWQWIDKAAFDYMTYDEFLVADQSNDIEGIDTLTRAFMICFERAADKSESAQASRVDLAKKWDTYFKNNPVD